jgi:hypothetical protein
MRGAIPPLTNTPSWRGARLKHRKTSTLPVTIHVSKTMNRTEVWYVPLKRDLHAMKCSTCNADHV